MCEKEGARNFQIFIKIYESWNTGGSWLDIWGYLVAAQLQNDYVKKVNQILYILKTESKHHVLIASYCTTSKNSPNKTG